MPIRNFKTLETRNLMRLVLLVGDPNYMRHLQLIRSKLGFYFSSGITLDIDVFLFGALPVDQLKIKHTKKLKEILSRHFLENLPEKASIYPLNTSETH